MPGVESVARLAATVDTAAICDADKATRVISGEIRCLSRTPEICGRAFTIRCRGDFFAVLRGLELAEPGDVLVVDGGGLPIALAGELVTRAAETRGLAGIVVDGGYRDIGYVASSELPVYARHVTPMAGTTKRLGEDQVPVSCGGAPVAPGDIVIADREGMVVLAPERAVAVLEAAQAVKRTEAEVISALREGGRLTHVLNLDQHRQLLQADEPSILRFDVPDGYARLPIAGN